MTGTRTAPQTERPQPAESSEQTEGSEPMEPGHLTTGWEPDLDLGDTLLRHYVHAYAATTLAPVAAMGGQVLRRDEVAAADLGSPGALLNAAVLTQPPTPDAFDATLDAVERFYADGRGQVFLWSPWPTPDLRARGWELEGHPPLLFRPEGTALPPGDDDLEIREVTDRRTLVDLKRVAVDGFPFEELQPFGPDDWLDERVLDLPDHHLFVGYAHGEPVVCGWSATHAGLGVLHLAAALPHARRKGYWSTMLRRRLRAIGERPVAAIFSDMSRPGAERYGFVPITRFTLWCRTR